MKVKLLHVMPKIMNIDLSLSKICQKTVDFFLDIKDVALYFCQYLCRLL